MVARKIDMHRLQELVRLHRLGTGPREIARLLKMSPNTERSYRTALVQAALLDGALSELPALEVLKQAVGIERAKTPHQEVSAVEPWREPVRLMLLDRGAGPRAIFDALRTEHNYKGSLSAIKRFCKRLLRERGPTAESVAISVETVAGEVAQVDFGYVGHLYDPHHGRARKAWVFVMVLGHSRAMYAEIVFDQKVATWVDLHVRAFQFFGGVPRVVVPDNLKAAVIRAAFGVDDEVALNRTYRELARAYGFLVDPTPPRAPKKKGKVESAVKYVKRNFFKPRELSDLDAARAALKTWLAEVANSRLHGTTGRQPWEHFLSEERDELRPLPAQPYEVVVWHKAQLHVDCHVHFDGRFYSAPWTLVGKPLWVHATPSTVTIFNDTTRVATHVRRGPERRSTCDEHLPEGRRDYRHRTREHWMARARDIGDEVANYVEAVFASDDVLLQLRTVQAMVRHLEGFPPTRARRACQRALYFGSFKYGQLKAILRKGLDLETLPDEAPAHGAPTLEKRRFARTPSEIINPNLELFASSEGETHEYH